jgi:hypothetical protein
MKSRITGLVLIFFYSLMSIGTAQPAIDGLPQVTSAYAITNANVMQQPGILLTNTNIVIENGVIRTMGSKIPIPAHAFVIKADSLYVYAGFIDGLSHTGIPIKSAGTSNNNSNQRGSRNRSNIKDPGNPSNEIAGIKPDQGVEELIKPTDKSIADMREIGFTLSHVVPRGKMFPGKGSLIILSGNGSDKMIFDEDISLFSQFRGSGGMYPNTVIGVIAKWRQMFRQAQLSLEHETIFAKGESGIERPQYDKATESLFPVVRKEIPVYFHTPDLLSMHRALGLQKDLGFDLVLANAKQSWHLLNEIKSQQIPLYVSLDLPEDKRSKEDKKKDEKSKESEAQSMKEIDKEREALLARQSMSLKEHYSQAATLEREGILFGFSSIDAKARDIRKNLRIMIEHGLTVDAALAGLTVNPAKILGVDKYAGTVEPGKLANLVISTGPYFEEKTKVKYVFSDGRMYEYDVKPGKAKKKSGGSGDEVQEIIGTWSFEVETPDQVQTGKFVFKGEPDDYRGVMITDDEGEEYEMDDIELNVNELTFTLNMDMGDGELTEIEFVLEVDEDYLEGKAIVGEFGGFPIEGNRKPEYK